MGVGDRNIDFVLQDSTSAGPILERLGKLARMTAMHWTTPISALNEIIFRFLELFPAIFPDNFIGMLRGSVWNYAMTSGNPLHSLLLMVSFAVVLVQIRSHGFDPRAQMVLVALVGYLLISFTGCSDVIVCMRYQYPFFMIGGILLGSVLPTGRGTFNVVLISLLILYSLPYVFINNMRPVIGMKPWPTRINSVFTEKPEIVLYAHFPNLLDEDAWIAGQIQESGCRQVGLALKREEFEYRFWWLLNAPQGGVEIEHLETTNATEKIRNPDFSPCAVICTVCEGREDFAGLPLVSDFKHVQYYAGQP
jgi:hypothetical protein